MGLLRWYGYWWKSRRLKSQGARCRHCGAKLAPAANDPWLRIALVLVALCGVATINSTVSYPPVLVTVFALVVGPLLHYGLVKCELLDRAEAVLPEARSNRTAM